MKARITENPLTWASALEQATQPGNYIAIKAGSSQTATFADKKSMEAAGYRKMRIAEITRFSENLLRNNEKAPELCKLRIYSSVDLLAQQADKEYNSTLTKVKLFFLMFLEVLTYCTIVGIPVGLAIHDYYKTKYNNEFEAAQKFLPKLSPQEKGLINLIRIYPEKKLPELLKLMQENKELADLMIKIPDLLQDINNPDSAQWQKEIISTCQDSFVVDVNEACKDKEHWNPIRLDQTRGGITFRLINDDTGYLSRGRSVAEWAEKNPLPQGDPVTSDDNRYMAWIYKQIDSFLPNINERNQWKPVVAALLTQAMPCVTKGPLNGVLMGNSTNGSFWSVVSEGNTTTIETVRDKDKRLSLKVEVTLPTKLQLASFATEKVVFPVEMSSILKFTVKLDGEKPVIENPSFTHGFSS